MKDPQVTSSVLPSSYGANKGGSLKMYMFPPSEELN